MDNVDTAPLPPEEGGNDATPRGETRKDKDATPQGETTEENDAMPQFGEILALYEKPKAPSLK